MTRLRLSGSILLSVRPPGMANSNESKKETVRIIVASTTRNAGSSAPERQTARIQLPTHPPPNPPPVPDSPSPIRVAAAAMPAPITTHSPKNETARMTALSKSPLRPAMEMKKTQLLIDLPHTGRFITKRNVVAAPPLAPCPPPEPTPQMRINGLPNPLCWGLLATSVAILILQIWNYLS